MNLRKVMYFALILSQVVPYTFLIADKFIEGGLTRRLVSIDDLWLFKFWFIAAFSISITGAIFALLIAAFDKGLSIPMRIVAAAAIILLSPISVTIYGIYGAWRESTPSRVRLNP